MKKWTLITGASSGLGYAFALEYAKLNQPMILIARRMDRLEELKAKINQITQAEVMIYQVDLAKRDKLEDFIQAFPNDWQIERLINNAGFGYAGPFSDLPLDKLWDMNEVNVQALTRLSQWVIPNMKKNQSGQILNVASMAGFTSGPYMAEYYASKNYVLSFSIALYEELKRDHILVSALCPGPTHTEFFQVASTASSGVHDTFTMDIKPVIQAAMNGLKKGKSIIIPGLSNKFLHVLMVCIPKSLSAKMVAKIQKGEI
jgi:short-subunit dehydrogenase